jgi:hypothetical protein
MNAANPPKNTFQKIRTGFDISILNLSDQLLALAFHSKNLT